MTSPSASETSRSAPQAVHSKKRSIGLRQILLITPLYLGGYVALHLISISFRTPLGIAPWYPPAALSLVLVVWGGRRYIPLLFIASMLVEILGNSLSSSPESRVLLSIILTLSYGGAGTILHSIVQLNPELCRLRDVIWLLGVGIILTPFVVAVSSVGSFALLGIVPAGEVRSSIITFWIGDAIGVATFAPGLLALIGRMSAQRRWFANLPGKLNLELCAQFLSIAAVMWLGVKFQRLQTISSFFFCVLPLLWVAVRQGFFRTTFAVLVTNISLMLFLVVPDHAPTLLVDVQLFMFTISLTGLIIGAVVTERQRVEGELHQSERYFRSLIENASDYITIVDRQGTVHYESPATQRIFGYPQGLAGKNVFDYIHPDDRRTVMEAFQRKSGARQLGQNVHYRFRRSDGSWRYLESSGNLFRTAGGGEIRLIINSRDVTERRRIEEALAALAQGAVSSTGNDFYQTLVVQLTLALQVQYAYVGLYDQDRRRITVIALCEHGQLGQNFTFTIDGMACEAVITQGISIFQAAARHHFPRDQSLQSRNIEGYMGIPLISSAEAVVGVLVVMAQEPLQHAKLKLSLLSLFADRVTAELERTAQEANRRDMERKLLETQKLESLGLLAGGIAHDFNNFLTTIMGNLNLALLEIDDGPLLTYLNTIEIATRRAADLSRQMLAYSGKGHFVVSQVSLNDLVQEMMRLLQVSIGKQICLEHHFGADLPLVEIDATQIRQVVMNLIVNASDSIGAQTGRITVRTGVTSLDQVGAIKAKLQPALLAERYVFIEVGDTGAGMDAATQARIFEPFFTTKFAGRGLGLAAVQGIVRSHHGILKVSSEVGRGSTFNVLLPCVVAGPLANTASTLD